MTDREELQVLSEAIAQRAERKSLHDSSIRITGQGSRVAIISPNGSRWYMTLTVNHGESCVSGGRSFGTLAGAKRAAERFVNS